MHRYELLYTPHIANSELWKISGHLDFYRESMFDQMEVENEDYQLRPMNCPFHVLIYKVSTNSLVSFSSFFLSLLPSPPRRNLCHALGS